MIHIGIDTGTHTGFAVWDSEKRQLLEIATLTITQAMDRVLIYRNIALETGHEIELHIEDARLRKWYGNSGRSGQTGRAHLGGLVLGERNQLPHGSSERQHHKDGRRSIQTAYRMEQNHLKAWQGCRDDGVRIMKLKTYRNESRNQPNDRSGNGNPLQPSHR